MRTQKPIDIGDIAVVPAGTENPSGKDVGGGLRMQMLGKWVWGQSTPGYEFWHTPCFGPARKLIPSDAARVDKNTATYYWRADGTPTTAKERRLARTTGYKRVVRAKRLAKEGRDDRAKLVEVSRALIRLARAYSDDVLGGCPDQETEPQPHWLTNALTVARLVAGTCGQCEKMWRKGSGWACVTDGHAVDPQTVACDRFLKDVHAARLRGGEEE